MNPIKKVKIVSIIAIVILIAFSICFLLQSRNSSNSINLTEGITSFSTTTPALSEWKTYENTKYHYRLKHPLVNLMLPRYAEGMKPDEKILHSISFAIGEDTLVGVFVPEVYLDVNNTTSEFVSIAKRLLPLDLKSFVQTVRQYQTDFVKNNLDYSSEYKNMIKMSEVTELAFLSNKAYSFTLVGPLHMGIQGPVVTSKFQTYRYIFLEHNERKYIIVSTHNDPLSESILNTFQFTN